VGSIRLLSLLAVGFIELTSRIYYVAILWVCKRGVWVTRVESRAVGLRNMPVVTLRCVILLNICGLSYPCAVTNIDIFFVDDAGQPRPSRPGMEPLLAVGGIALVPILRGANLGDGGLTARR